MARHNVQILAISGGRLNRATTAAHRGIPDCRIWSAAARLGSCQLEGGIGLRVAPNLYLSGGWDWQQHRSKTSLFGVTADVEDTGYAFGLRYVAPVASRAKPWVRAGGLYDHVEIEDSNAGSLVADSEHTFGFEVGGGLDVALNDAWSLTPGVRYRRFEPEVRRGSVRSPSTLSYVTYDVGLMLTF